MNSLPRSEVIVAAIVCFCGTLLVSNAQAQRASPRASNLVAVITIMKNCPKFFHVNQAFGDKYVQTNFGILNNAGKAAADRDLERASNEWADDILQRGGYQGWCMHRKQVWDTTQSSIAGLFR